jgi:hypothetical protein
MIQCNLPVPYEAQGPSSGYHSRLVLLGFVPVVLKQLSIAVRDILSNPHHQLPSSLLKPLDAVVG